jgi:hypothetical protein
MGTFEEKSSALRDEEGAIRFARVHGWAKPCVKPCVEQAFARIEASFLIRRDKRWSTPVELFDGADRPGESVQYDNCHRNQSGVTRSRQSSKKPRR